MPGEVGKPMRGEMTRREMTSSVKSVHAHSMATNSRTRVKGHEQ
jgi:hypothetical protein